MPLNLGLFLFLAVGVLIFFIAYSVHKSSKKAFLLAKDSIESKGYCVGEVYMKPFGTSTRIWGVFPSPVSVYIQFSNLDPVQSIAGELGIADIKVGDLVFDRAFVVRSNEPKRAHEILDENIRKKLLSMRRVRYRTGSVISLLGVDYSGIAQDDDLRYLWSIEVPGTNESHDIPSLLQFVQSINQRVLKLSEQINDPSKERLKVAFFEGR
jgi:hypothetical protein